MTSALPITPARRSVLAIGVPIVLALIGFTGFNLVADIGQASYPVSYNVPVRDGQISLGTGGGDLAVHPGGTAGVGHLAGTVHYSLERPDLAVHPTASGTDVSFQCRLVFGNCEMDATLAVPARTAISLSSEGGNLSASGLTGDVSMSTGGGDLAVTGLPGQLRLNTSGGNIDGNALTSKIVTATTGGGDVTLTFTSVPRNVHITTSGGNIDVVLPHDGPGYNLHTSTAGGNTSDSTVDQNPSSPYAVTASTGGGDITITEAS